MSDLGSLYFALGLDSDKFDNAIKAAKAQIENLDGTVTVKVITDIQQVQDSLSKLSVGNLTPKIDKSAIEKQIKDIENDLNNLQGKIDKETNRSTPDMKKFSEMLEQRKTLEASLTKLKSQISSMPKEIESNTPSVKISLELTESEKSRIKSEIKKSLANAGVEVSITPKISKKKATASVKASLQGLEQTISVKPVIPKKNLKKIELEANQSVLRNSVTKALKNQRFKAKLELVVEKASVQDAIKQAFAEAGIQWNTTASDVRAARVREIDSRTASRELIDQEKLNQLRDKGLDSSNKKANRLLDMLTKGSTWATELNNQIGNAFSLYAIEHFIRQLYTVGGEFQKQEIALRNMIGDASKASALFEKMKDLSVKSPFTFSELASYTKQMAAYGVEYEELYDTTKRLADISAGVGVDMSRLILAYGQVRSAEVLRGQELRQFTEAGIPIVAELAKRLEEVRGKSVAIGEVFDAISKREISFGMVKDVLFDMTDPGGRFFQTQEELAESLAGKWSNLKDAWDIMLADIANGSNTTLAGMADITAVILRNWEMWLPAIVGVTTALGLFRAVMSLVIPLQKAFNILTKANPWIALASGIVGVGAAIYGYATNTETAVEAVKRLNAEHEKEKQSLKEKEETANRYLDTLSLTAKSEEEKLTLQKRQEATLNEFVKMYSEYQGKLSLEKLTLEDIARLRGEISEKTQKGTQASLIETRSKLISQRMDLERELATMQKTNTSNKNPLIKSEAFYKIGEWMNNTFGTSDTDIDAKIQEINTLNQSILDLDKSIKQVSDQDLFAEAVKKLTPETGVEDYISIYGEIGKAVKILKQNGIDSVLSKPEFGTDFFKYYDSLVSALDEQDKIMEKFAPETKIHKDAEKLSKIYKAAIESIGGVIKIDTNNDDAKENGEEYAKAFADGIKEELDKITSQWSLYKQLFEKTGDKTFAMTAFNSTPVWDDAAKQMHNILKEAAKSQGIDWDIDYDISDANAKELYGDLYSSWKEIKDRIEQNGIDLKINAADAISESKDFAQQIEDIERKLQEKLQALRVAYANNPEKLKRAEQEAISTAEEEKTKVNFEEFKKSSNWVKVFDDLDRVSNDVLDRMILDVEKFAARTNLGVQETKELVEALRKLRNEAMDRNPFKGITDALNKLNSLKDALGRGKWRDGFYRVKQSDGTYSLMTEEQIKQQQQKGKSDVDTGILAMVNKFQKVTQAADLLGNMFGSLGIDVSNFTNALNDIAAGASTGASIAGGKGAIIGGLIGVLTAAFSSYDRNRQEAIEDSNRMLRVIEKYAERLDDLLLKNLGGIYTMSIDDVTRKMLADFADVNKYASNLDIESVRWLRKNRDIYDAAAESADDALKDDSYYKAQLALLEMQRVELERQKHLEADKKNASKEKLADYDLEIAELESSIKSFAQDMLETIYGVDFKDWANQFTDSIVDAWSKGEDAATAYKNTVANVMRNVAASVIQQGIIGKWLEENMNKVLDLFHENGGIITDDVYSALVDLAAGVGGKIEETEAFLDTWEKLLNERGLSMKDISDSESGTLSKGIQSVTEDTANLLGTYLNSIRQDVSVKRNLIEKLIGDDIPKMSFIAQAQLRELSQIQANTKRNADAADKIYDLVNRVVDKGNNKLKV